MAKTDILKEIILNKQKKIILAKQLLPEDELRTRIQGLSPARPFIEAIRKPRQISLIAEIKKASPSQGVIKENFNHIDIAKVYQEAGVQAISVLTEEDYFQGSLNFINEVKAAAQAPVLRKDFILEPYQVYESRYFGADAILLIAGILTQDELGELSGLALSLGLDCLVEVHTEKELKKVLKLKGIPMLGINNRSLRTFEVDPKTVEKLYTFIPKDKVVVVESGISSPQDVLFLKILGVNAILIGTVFMRAADIRGAIDEIMGW